MPKERTDSTRVTLRIPEGMMEKITSVGETLGLPATRAVMHCLTLGVQASLNTVSQKRSADLVEDFMGMMKEASSDTAPAARAERKPKARRSRARA